MTSGGERYSRGVEDKKESSASDPDSDVGYFNVMLDSGGVPRNAHILRRA